MAKDGPRSSFFILTKNGQKWVEKDDLGRTSMKKSIFRLLSTFSKSDLGRLFRRGKFDFSILSKNRLSLEKNFFSEKFFREIFSSFLNLNGLWGGVAKNGQKWVSEIFGAT